MQYLYYKFLLKGVDINEITQCALQAIRERCLEEGIEFVVAVTHYSHDIEGFLQNNGFQWIDVTKISDSEHLEDSHNGEQGVGKWTYVPFDDHPNANANAIMADNLLSGLKEILKSRSIVHNDDIIEVSDQNYNSNMHEVYPLF